jgi:hypothetical protein
MTFLVIGFHNCLSPLQWFFREFPFAYKFYSNVQYASEKTDWWPWFTCIWSFKLHPTNCGTSTVIDAWAREGLVMRNWLISLHMYYLEPQQGPQQEKYLSTAQGRAARLRARVKGSRSRTGMSYRLVLPHLTVSAQTLQSPWNWSMLLQFYPCLMLGSAHSIFWSGSNIGRPCKFIREAVHNKKIAKLQETS